MATSNVENLTALLKKSSLADKVIDETDPVKLSSSLFPNQKYTDVEKTEIASWSTTASHLSSSEDAAKKDERYAQLNTLLSSNTTLLGSKPSVADIAVYQNIAPQVKSWTPEERTGANGYHHIVRFVDFVQNSPVYGLGLADSDKVAIDPNEVLVPIKPVDLKAEKERKKKEKEAAAAAAATGAAAGATPTTLSGQPAGTAEQGQKSTKEKVKDKAEQLGDAVAAAVGKEAPTQKKKEKQPKQPKAKAAPAAPKPLSPALIDLRVAHILKAVKHPDADSLYVSTVACGDAPGTDNTSEYEGQVVRTVCSGLNGLIPLEEMQGRKIVAVCNLKPVTMRGVKSCAMVLAASPRIKEGDDPHKGPVELVNPPADAKAGDCVYFEGWEGEPEGQLNPKKKVWETIQPGFTTTSALEVGFDVAAVPELAGEGETKKTGVGKLKTAAGVCTVSTLQDATVR